MVKVEISAKVISWPKVCACCCRDSDTHIVVSHTRVTGERVIRSQTKSWEVPYCQKCLGHINVSHELQRFSMDVPHFSVIIGVSGAAISLLMLLVFMYWSKLLAICLFVIAVVATIVLVIKTRPWCESKYQEELQAKEHARQALVDRLESLRCPDCAQLDRFAAGYGGWYGTIHTFYFSNQNFVRLFKNANPGKCLG